MVLRRLWLRRAHALRSPGRRLDRARAVDRVITRAAADGALALRATRDATRRAITVRSVSRSSADQLSSLRVGILSAAALSATSRAVLHERSNAFLIFFPRERCCACRAVFIPSLTHFFDRIPSTCRSVNAALESVTDRALLTRSAICPSRHPFRRRLRFRPRCSTACSRSSVVRVFALPRARSGDRTVHVDPGPVRNPPGPNRRIAYALEPRPLTTFRSCAYRHPVRQRVDVGEWRSTSARNARGRRRGPWRQTDGRARHPCNLTDLEDSVGRSRGSGAWVQGCHGWYATDSGSKEYI